MYRIFRVDYQDHYQLSIEARHRLEQAFNTVAEAQSALSRTIDHIKQGIENGENDKHFAARFRIVRLEEEITVTFDTTTRIEVAANITHTQFR